MATTRMVDIAARNPGPPADKTSLRNILSVTPCTPETERAAAVTIADHATGAADCRRLLAMLGLVAEPNSRSGPILSRPREDVPRRRNGVCVDCGTPTSRPDRRRCRDCVVLTRKRPAIKAGSER